MIRTFVDSGVLLTVHRGKPEDSAFVYSILTDPQRIFIASEFLRLEVLPKTIYNKRREQTELYEKFFNRVNTWVSVDDLLLESALDEASKKGLSAVDALHVVAASVGNADVLITTEKETKPIYRTRLVKVVYYLYA